MDPVDAAMEVVLLKRRRDDIEDFFEPDEEEVRRFMEEGEWAEREREPPIGHQEAENRRIAAERAGVESEDDLHQRAVEAAMGHRDVPKKDLTQDEIDLERELQESLGAIPREIEQTAEEKKALRGRREEAIRNRFRMLGQVAQEHGHWEHGGDYTEDLKHTSHGSNKWGHGMPENTVDGSVTEGWDEEEYYGDDEDV